MNCKFEVNKEKCIGCGLCQNMFPNLFETKNNLATAKENNNANCDSKEIIDICPCGAIEIKDKK